MNKIHALLKEKEAIIDLSKPEVQDAEMVDDD